MSAAEIMKTTFMMKQNIKIATWNIYSSISVSFYCHDAHPRCWAVTSFCMQFGNDQRVLSINKGNQHPPHFD